MTDAVAFFRAELTFRTDVSDVHAALQSPSPGFVLVDSRGVAGWAQARIPAAVHMPTAEIATRAPEEIPVTTPVVTYCWGPGCNGATRAALEFARLGYRVREMQGGVEYWIREGLPVLTGTGLTNGGVDPLTAPASVPACGC